MLALKISNVATRNYTMKITNKKKKEGRGKYFSIQLNQS